MFNGFALSITGAIPPAVSEVWFPFKERSTATAIAALAGGLGGAANFIIGNYWRILRINQGKHIKHMQLVK